MENWTYFLAGLEDKLRNNDLTKDGMKMIVFINNLITPNSINFNLFIENMTIVEELPWAMVPENYGTISLNQLAKNKEVIPMGYNNYFIASFPDVYLWTQNNFEIDKELIKLFDKFSLFQDIYLGEDKKFSISFYLKMCELYKLKGFEFELNK